MKSASEVFDHIRGLDEQSPGHIKSKHGPKRKTRKGSGVTSAHGPVVEDQEQIEEISKETLKSYIPKAMGSKSAADFQRGVKMAQGTGGEEELRKKSEKRSTGIHTAIKKLTNESQLDEISAGVAGDVDRARLAQSKADPTNKAKREKSKAATTNYMKRVHRDAYRGHTPDDISKGRLKGAEADVKRGWSIESVQVHESRQKEIVREALKSAKEKKKKSNTEDKFEANPELTSQIIRND